MKAYEVNFDALIGPVHNYAGLSFGNVASLSNRMSTSNPRTAALQGLEKMRFVASLGIPQGVIPPQPRPYISLLRQLGFYGNDQEILAQVYRESPQLLREISSASSMWAANCATITPSFDSTNNRVHITPANLSSKFHRSIEIPVTTMLLKSIFSDPIYFEHHDALPYGNFFSDEGAANHTRLSDQYESPGIHLFVYGKKSFKENLHASKKYPARQALEASESIARLHKLLPSRVFFLQQNPEAIDAGVFHNDVIAVGNNRALLYHEKAYCQSDSAIAELQEVFEKTCHTPLSCIEVKNQQVPIQDAVSSYLFNSQLLTLPDGSMTLIAPSECEETPSVFAFLENLIRDADNPIGSIHYVNIRESMRNGGGPACLRIRVILSEKELKAVNQKFILTDELYESLKDCITKHYRDHLAPEDLMDPLFCKEALQAVQAIYDLFGLSFKS